MEVANQINCTMAEESIREMLALGTGKVVEYDRTQTVVSCFVKQAEMNPLAGAVVDDKGTLSYRELDRKSNSLAAYLRTNGVQENDFVCVRLPRVKEFIVAVLGIWKAGAAYVPIDVEYPEERIRYMTEDSNARLTIDEEFFANNSLEENTNAINYASPGQLAYMIYTSGSTGKPKGVMISHSSLSAYMVSMKTRYNITSDDRSAEFVSFSFDASVPGLFPPLVYGGTVHILGSQLRKDLHSLAAYLNENRITYTAMPTSMGIELLRSRELGLRFIQLGGEKLNYIPKTNVQIYNEYGPTEFSVCATAFPVKQGVDYDNIPIGRPVANSVCVVIDEEGRLLPRGEMGELALIGPQISKGYWHRPELTAEKFADVPFIPGEKMYRTGDLVRWDNNGDLIFEGRIDDQIKFHGFRIEKGEVEARLLNIPGIRNAAVEVKTINGIQHLVGYYVSEKQLDPGQIITLLSRELADYMIPRLYVRLDKMPLTPNGKVNRKSLPVPEIQSSECIEPATYLEELLLRTCQNVLKTKDFGVTDDMLNYGLDSLASFIISATMHDNKVIIKAEDILRLRTVRAIAANRTSLGNWYGEYDPAKPVMVFVSGLVPYSLTGPLISKCAEAFNCFVTEPLQGHYDYIFADENVDEVSALYNAYFKFRTMGKAKVSVFMGFCFGGEIAANMAFQYAEANKVKPALVLLDTKFIDGSDYVSNEEIERLLTDQNEISVQKEMNRIGEALTKERIIHPYDGPILEFLATVAEPVIEGQVVDRALYAEQNEACRRILSSHFPNLRMVEMETGHFSMLNHFSDLCFPHILDLLTFSD